MDKVVGGSRVAGNVTVTVSQTRTSSQVEFFIQGAYSHSVATSQIEDSRMDCLL